VVVQTFSSSPPQLYQKLRIRENQSMIRKSANRFSEKIMLKQRDEIMIRWIMI